MKCKTNRITVYNKICLDLKFEEVYINLKFESLTKKFFFHIHTHHHSISCCPIKFNVKNSEIAKL
jgi:hypothetical protein